MMLWWLCFESTKILMAKWVQSLLCHPFRCTQWMFSFTTFTYCKLSWAMQNLKWIFLGNDPSFIIVWLARIGCRVKTNSHMLAHISSLIIHWQYEVQNDNPCLYQSNSTVSEQKHSQIFYEVPKSITLAIWQELLIHKWYVAPTGNKDPDKVTCGCAYHTNSRWFLLCQWEINHVHIRLHIMPQGVRLCPMTLKEQLMFIIRA